MFTMEHFASRNADGTIHCTNTVGGMTGQHRVHDEESWQQWLAGAPEKGIGPVNPDRVHWLDAEDCSCGQEIWRRAAH